MTQLYNFTTSNKLLHYKCFPVNFAKRFRINFLWNTERYTNVDFKICQYLRLHVNITCWRFHIKTPFTFWDMRTCDMWKICLQTFRNNSFWYKHLNFAIYNRGNIPNLCKMRSNRFQMFFTISVLKASV